MKMKKIIKITIPIATLVAMVMSLSIVPIVKILALVCVVACLSYSHIERCKDRHETKDMLIGDLVLIIAMTMMLTISIFKMLL